MTFWGQSIPHEARRPFTNAALETVQSQNGGETPHSGFDALYFLTRKVGESIIRSQCRSLARCDTAHVRRFKCRRARDRATTSPSARPRRTDDDAKLIHVPALEKMINYWKELYSNCVRPSSDARAADAEIVVRQ